MRLCVLGLNNILILFFSTYLLIDIFNDGDGEFKVLFVLGFNINNIKKHSKNNHIFFNISLKEIFKKVSIIKQIGRDYETTRLPR